MFITRKYAIPSCTPLFISPIIWLQAERPRLSQDGLNRRWPMSIRSQVSRLLGPNFRWQPATQSVALVVMLRNAIEVRYSLHRARVQQYGDNSQLRYGGGIPQPSVLGPRADFEASELSVLRIGRWCDSQSRQAAPSMFSGATGVTHRLLVVDHNLEVHQLGAVVVVLTSVTPIWARTEDYC
jgi:hypothetical protein